jgi:hypothetical protein
MLAFGACYADRRYLEESGDFIKDYREDDLLTFLEIRRMPQHVDWTRSVGKCSGEWRDWSGLSAFRLYPTNQNSRRPVLLSC